jgi:hypothetical protein
MQKDLDDGLAVHCSGFDVFDIVDRCGEDPLVYAGKPSFQFLRIKARILPGDGNHGNVDVWKNVRRRAQDHDWT